MSKKDTMTKEYMSKGKYFADAFNSSVFGGRQVIKADEMTLQEMDPTELGIVFANEEMDIVQKYRDILKRCVLMSDGKMRFLLLGIENQSEVHYAMPVRNLLYDALNYGQQVNRIATDHRKEKNLKNAEYLSGFSKTDKIIPLISLVIYFGSDKWDGPRSLKEMFPEDIDKEILNEVEDYRLHLIIPSEITDFSKFKTDFGIVMKYIAVSESRSEMSKLCEDEMFRTVGVDTVRLINECTGSNIEVEEEEEVVDMCNGLRELLEEERQKGRDEVCNGLKELMEEERQKGRDEVCNGLKELMEEKRMLGREEGIKEGMGEMLYSQVSRKIRKNLSLEKIAEDLEEDIEVIRPVYEKAKAQM